MITIGLVGHSSRSDNMGVGALTVSEVNILRDAAARIGCPLKVLILDWKQPRAPYVTGDDVEVWDMTGKSLIQPQGYFTKVRNCDAVVDIGGGDSFADIYGPKRLTRMLLMKYLVHIALRPLILAPQTYGPFTKRMSRVLSAFSMRRAKLVASRDWMSTQAVGKLAADVAVIEASDVALRLPYTPPAPRADGSIKVGLNVSGLLMNGGYTRANMFGLQMDYAKMIQTVVEQFLARPEDIELHIIPHVITGSRDDVEDDLQPALKLQRQFPQIIVPEPFANPSEAKSYISDMDFFAGARMHACIAAFSTGVPVVPMAYSRKFAGLFGTLGYNRTVDCTSQDAQTIIDVLFDSFEARDTLSNEIQPALALGLEKLARYEHALEDVLRTIWTRKNRA